MDFQLRSDDYEPFLDYKNIMVQAFNIGCSWCGNSNITYVHKNHPMTIGNFVKKYGENLSDSELDIKLVEPLNSWQIFDDELSNQQIPTFLCDECFNSYTS